MGMGMGYSQDRFLPVEDRLMTWQLEQEEKKHRLRASTPTGESGFPVFVHVTFVPV